MPPKYSSRKRVADVQDYDSDGGFIEDAPKSKRAKTSKAPPSKDLKKDDNGNEYWELSDKRRVSLSTFKNMQLINIREFYEKDGTMLPGKKGISLSVQQFSAFLEILPQIETALKSKGESVPRPSYDGGHGTASSPPSAAIKEVAHADDVEEAQQLVEEDPDGVNASGKLEKFTYAKKNHEATSDEEEQE